MRLRVPDTTTLRPGAYEAVLERIELRESDDGREYLRWSFEVRTRTGTTRLTATSSTSLGPRSKTRRWLESLLGRPLQPGEEIDLTVLEGTPCTVVVATTTRPDGMTWSTVESVTLRDETP